MVEWGTNVIEFNPNIIDESERIIEGVSTGPVVDRTGELITKEAIEAAVPDFMVLPILTVLHKSYVVGKVLKSEVDDNGYMRVRAVLKQTKDTDKVWELVKSGYLNSFSIAGTRTNTTCSRYGSGNCVTTGITMNNITLCPSAEAANQAAYLDVVKTIFGEDYMTESTEITGDLKKMDAPTDPVPQTIDMSVLASMVVDELEARKVSKMTEEKKEEEKKEEKKEDDFEKMFSEFRATLDAQFADFATKMEDISRRVENIENQPLQKTLGFTVVGDHIVPVDLQKMQSNPSATSDDDLSPARKAGLNYAQSVRRV